MSPGDGNASTCPDEQIESGLQRFGPLRRAGRNSVATSVGWDASQSSLVVMGRSPDRPIVLTAGLRWCSSL